VDFRLSVELRVTGVSTLHGFLSSSVNFVLFTEFVKYTIQVSSYSVSGVSLRYRVGRIVKMIMDFSKVLSVGKDNSGIAFVICQQVGI